MENDNDFTFCQLGPPSDKEESEAQKIVPGISGITIDDESSSNGTASQRTGVLWNDKMPKGAISKKEATVGSLFFNVIDSSSSKQSRTLSRNVASEYTAGSEKQKIGARKPAPRAKVPFEKGYSQMDWLKLTRTHPDLAGTAYLMKMVFIKMPFISLENVK